MPTEIMLWRIEDDTPKPVSQNKLDLESRLENWIRDDIGLVNDDLLVIGQQVPTDHTGEIDLLAMDSDGNLVILELKRTGHLGTSWHRFWTTPHMCRSWDFRIYRRLGRTRIS